MIRKTDEKIQKSLNEPNYARRKVNEKLLLEPTCRTNEIAGIAAKLPPIMWVDMDEQISCVWI